MSTPASPSTSFQPRKEFARDDTRSNSFALMAIAGSNLLRLYSFQFSLVSLFRRLLEQRHLLANYREDSVHSFYEFALESKPWADSKGLNSERFLLEIIAIVYRHGYSYVSSINYGREPDERLAMTFSCPTQLLESQAHLSILPSHTLGAPEMSYDGFTLQTPTNYRVPFALSFTSATTLRVINPPLHATPAILAAVKDSWPRGVDSEKKIGDACYEFKLRGYKWFQADTFATDSLKYILSLLNALDARGFVLLASLSLSSRSRTKDLWIFTGPPPPADGVDTSIYDSFAMQPISMQNSEKGLGADLRRSTTGPTRRVPPPYSARSPFTPVLDSKSFAIGGAQSQHQRSATDGNINVPPGGGPYPPPPLPPRPNPNTQTDQRSSSRSSFGGRNILRKAPRAQVPVSVVSEDLERATLPSVGSSAVNMTGVGTGMAGWYPADQHHPEEHGEEQGGGEVIYSTSNYPPPDLRYEDERLHGGDESDHDDGVPEFEQQEDFSSNEDGMDSAAEAGPSTLRGFNSYDYNGSPSTQPTSHASPQPSSSHEGSTSAATRPGLLGKGVFAGGDSDFSAFSAEHSRNTQGFSRDLGMIPTDVFRGHDGPQSAREEDNDREEEEIDATSGDAPRQPFVRRTSSTPAFPGAWAPSPEKEKEEPTATRPAPVDEVPEDGELEETSSDNNKQVSSSSREHQSVQSVEPAHRVKLMSFLGRKSHVGVVGNIEDPAPQVPPVPTAPAGAGVNPNDADGAGWVYIDTSRPGAPSDQKQQVPQDVGDKDPVEGQAQVDGAAAAYAHHHQNNNSGSVGEDSASTSDRGSRPSSPVAQNNGTMAPGTPDKTAKELDGTGDPGTEGKKRRFFSLRDRSKGHDESGGGHTVVAGSPTSPKATKSGLRDRLKKQLG